MIVMAKNLTRETQQPRLGVMDVVVERNAYGRQVDSFEADLTIPCLGEPSFRGVFIRAPKVAAAGPGVEVLCRLNGDVVFVRQGNLLAAAFPPELTSALRVPRYFLDLVAAA
jgi:5'-phosphate synthase pdxT subunit